MTMIIPGWPTYCQSGLDAVNPSAIPRAPAGVESEPIIRNHRSPLLSARVSGYPPDARSAAIAIAFDDMRNVATLTA